MAVVLLYFELCEQIWGGSPATSTIPCGIESCEILTGEEVSPQEPDDQNDSSTSMTPGSEVNARPHSPAASVGSLDQEEGSSTPPTTPVSREKSTKERRNLLTSRLNNYKQEKLKRKLPVESQLLSIAQEDSKVKKQMLDKMEIMDKEYCESMKSLSRNIEKLTDYITDGFSLFGHVLMAQTQMCAAAPMPYSQPHYQGLNMYQDQTGPSNGSQQFPFNDGEWQ